MGTSRTKPENKAYDVVVIGAGPGGYVAAIRAAQYGASVAIVERNELGGVCLNWGCIPTKTLIYATDLYRKMQHAGDYGLDVKGLTLNLSAVIKRKNEVVRKNKAGIQSLLKANRVDVLKGEGRVTAPGVVSVDGQSIKARSIILATGSSPADLPGLELDGKQVISSTEALELTEPPKRVAVIGAGPLGAEFACVWNTLGSQVTMIEMMPNILPKEDEEIVSRLATLLTRRGMDIRTDTKVGRLTKNAKSVHLELEGSKAGSIDVDCVLVGIGRTYHSDVVSTTPSLGVALGKRDEILVDERMETNVKGIFAIGDVTGKTLLAHGASAEGLVAAANAVGKNSTMDYRVLPACTFTTPEVASVGFTEKAAVKQGYTIKTGRFSFISSGRAHAMGETEGLVKIVGDAATDEVLGVHIMGAEAGELIAVAALAMKLEATVEDIAHTIHTHPTLSETLMEAAEDYLGLGIHSLPRKS